MTTISSTDPRVETFPAVARRFLRYVQIDTRADYDSRSTPSTEKQKDLGRMLVEELRTLGVADVEMDAFGYVYAKLPARDLDSADTARLALLAHVDTSPDEPGAARPLIHLDYDGSVITLPGDPRIALDPSTRPELREHVGHDLITSDGTTLLGSDDKAGVAVLMQLAEDLLRDDASPRPEIRLCFTVDEEIGRGVDRLDLARLDATVAYTVDGGGTSVLYAETFNAAEAVVDVRGVMVHPGYARNVMVNALRVASELISLLPAGEAPETTSGREGYLHPYRIHESDAGRALVSFLLRDFSDEGLARRKRLLESAVETLRIKYPRAHVDLRITDQYRNMRAYIEESDARAIHFAHEAAATIGLTLEERLVRGGTDGARLSELGIPTPNVFNGGHDHHSRFEWNTVQNLQLSLAFAKALVRYWGTHGAR